MLARLSAMAAGRNGHPRCRSSNPRHPAIQEREKNTSLAWPPPHVDLSCGLVWQLLISVRLAVEEVYGPSPVAPNSLVTVNIGHVVLNLQLAPQRWQQKGIDTLDVVVAITRI